MFNSIIIALGLQIIFVDNATIPCGTPANGCYNTVTKEIFLGYNSDDINRTFYHEMAHAMFYKDFGRNEELPRLFAEYMKNKEYIRNNYPEVYQLFENKLKSYN